MLFLDADEQTLLNRYKETRRRHPLAPEGVVADGIAAERARSSRCTARADLVIDTTGLSAAMLRGKIVEEFLRASTPGAWRVTFMSFGFKHGPPRDADLAFDVRFLPNPHYEPELRELTGLDQRGRRVHRARRPPRASSTSAWSRCSTSCSASTSPRARPTS